jgi:VanZ family protein
MFKIINVTLLTIYCSLIYWLSSKTVLPTPSLFIHQDKVLHFGAYFIMGILAWHFFYDYFFTNPLIVFIVSLLFCSFYGLSDEWHQSFVNGREADFLDWLADTMGALIATSIHFYRVKKANRYY